MDAFVGLATGASILAGAIAALAGFGIGSLLTPVLSLRFDVRLAIALVSLPHLAGTLARLLLVRAYIDREVLVGFGLASAVGGLLGAALQAALQSSALALAGGAASGLLGGLVGNQGGIRAAALLGFDVDREAFVATATAVALIVDAARIPVYLASQGRDIAAQLPLVSVLALGAVLGTLLGAWALRRIPEPIFRRVVGVLLLALGVYTLGRAIS